MSDQLGAFDRARLHFDYLRRTDANINTSIEKWTELRASYDAAHEAQEGHSRSFTSWSLASIDARLITRIGEHMHAADFNSLPAEKSAELRKIAKAFDTNAWMVFFVLGTGLITESVKGLKLILRIKRQASYLTLEVVLNGLEKVRKGRRGTRQRNVSNDITKFTYQDVKHFQHTLFSITDPSQLSIPSSDGRNNTTFGMWSIHSPKT